MSESKYRVLVVEDDSEWQEIFRELLVVSGCKVDVVSDVSKAGVILQKCNYELILLDIGLDQPDFNTVCQQFCELLKLSHSRVPMFATSGKRLSTGEMATLFKEYHPVDFVDKGSLDRSNFKQQIQKSLADGRNALPTVVLLTVNEHETSAVLDTFIAKRSPRSVTRAGVTYNKLGVHGNMHVVHTICEMGTSTYLQRIGYEWHAEQHATQTDADFTFRG